MTNEELIPIFDEFAFLLDCYEALSKLTNENESHQVILNNLNGQFRNLTTRLDQLGLLS
jgi:hypothetical protein